MEDQVSLKEFTNIIRLFKDETGRHFEILQNNMSEVRIQLQHDIKEVQDNLSALTVSLDNTWSEVDSMKTQLQCKQKEIKTLKSSGAVLSARVDAEKQEKLRLDTYSRREKLRLIGIPEGKDIADPTSQGQEEACEVIVRNILQDMGITREIAGFHAVHRVGPMPCGPDGKPSRRQIIMRFISRKDRNKVWRKKEGISKAKKYPGGFFVQDYLCAAERVELRRIAKKARDSHKMKVGIKYNKIVMADPGVSCSLKELPQ